MRTFSIHTVRNLFAVVVIVGLGYLAYVTNPVSVTGPNVEAVGENVSGYAWSDTVGWIQFSGSWASGVSINPTTGTGIISGSAWSRGTTENGGVGWISFDRAVTGNPNLALGDPGLTQSGSPLAYVDWSTGDVYGWARALSACNQDVSGNLTPTPCTQNSNAGGWDGWIKLSGTWTNGVKINPADGKFSGYAWGGAQVDASGNSIPGGVSVIGWIDFAPSVGGTPVGVQGPTSVVTCSVGEAYYIALGACFPCGGAGCSGSGATSLDPNGVNGDLHCNVTGTVPPLCSCVAPDVMFNGQCVANCPNGATVASSCATCPSGQTFNAAGQCANVKPKYQQF